MKAFVEIPLAYRLAIMFAAGILLGHLANLLAFALGSRTGPGRSPWSRLHPYDGKSRWLDRLPLVGWLRLGRKSEQLGRAFWVLPLLAELAMGGFCAGLYEWEVGKGMVLSGGQVAAGAKFPPSPITWEIMHAVFAAHVVLAFFMLAATLIDFDERIIPDEITVPGTLIGLMLAAGYPWTLMPVDVHLKPPGIQFVEFMTLVYPSRSYPDDWPAYLEAPKQTLPLLIALAVYEFWCLSLLPWLWLPRRGFETAVRMFIGHATRSPYFPSIVTIALCGGGGIVMVWWLGGPGWAALLSSLAGLAVGGGLIWSVRLIFSAILGKEAMGFGDVTLLAMIGAYLGWQAPIFIFFVAPCIGLVFGGTQWALGMGREIPYGPFLCLGTAVVIVFWRWFWQQFIVYFQPVADIPISPIWMVLLLFLAVGCILGVPIQVYRSYQHRKSQAA
ncbi:MAG TPA: A24 family peptidase [Pirellulales bacterium]|nr:A24 family peptidase [Pirellulales bacterium]